ncbi:alpha-1,3-mannosyl-glycoprotein 4-beta-N-acetylglucosaminyltransferase-like protein MGAT4E [Molossus nigricans]
MSLWKYAVMVVSFISLSLFLLDNKKELEYSISLEEKEKVLQQLDQEQISSESKNHMETFKKMQINSPMLQHANYKVMAGASPWEKKLLTVGISSVQRPHGRTLLRTLQSLFEASSEPELNYIVVLVHLSDPDPQWLSQTVANISGLFQPHIEAQKLLVIHGRLGGSSVPGDLGNTNDDSPCEAVYSRQKVNYALLMNFALSLSEYFLMIEDHVYCIPGFVSTIYWALSAWKERPWVTLEFSSLSFSGKVFHSSDLSRLATFLLLFPKDTPTHLLLSEFRLLLAQHIPIRFGSPVFYAMSSYSAEDTCFPVQKEMVFGEPDNPIASVVTDMMTISDVIPQYAYVLNDECYSTFDPLRGNYLTVILERPQKVIRIQVLTGSDKERLYWLQKGQIELGYNTLEYSEGCAQYTLLGPLVQGNLDQRVFYGEDAVGELSCIRLLVLASQDSWLLIRQIRVWTQPEEES